MGIITNILHIKNIGWEKGVAGVSLLQYKVVKKTAAALQLRSSPAPYPLKVQEAWNSDYVKQ